MATEIIIASRQEVPIVKLKQEAGRTLRDLAGTIQSRIEALSEPDGKPSPGNEQLVQNMEKIAQSFLAASEPETNGLEK